MAFETGDGFRLTGRLYRTDGDSPPGIVLVHMLGSDRSHWDYFAKRASQHGYMALAYDMRGHGDSRIQNGTERSHRDFNKAEWRDAIHDIAAAKKALLAAGADPDNLAVLGASVGANLALGYAALDREIQAVVLLSPGEDYRGVTSLPAMEKLRKRPVLILAAAGDSYAAASSARLDEVATSFSELLIYPGNAHGTTLLDSNDGTTEEILDWLKSIFDGKAVENAP